MRTGNENKIRVWAAEQSSSASLARDIKRHSVMWPTRNTTEFDGSKLREAIRFLESQPGNRFDENEDGAAPIFLLSSGWRSGSTLVQRLINSDSSVLMWGEPF